MSQPIPAIPVGSAQVARLLARITCAPGPHEEIVARAPYTGQVVASLPAGSEADAELAVQRARSAQAAWAQLSTADRARVFLRFHDLRLDRREEALDLIQIENGKARRHALEEVFDTAVVCRYYALRAEGLLRARKRRGAIPGLTRTWELRSPLGVVGLIVPWNYPLSLAVTDAAPALLAGNTVVLKPDPQTSLTALWAADLLIEAGLPPDVLPVITGEGAVLGPALGERADYLMFTGSTRTGKLVARQAAERLIGCSLELGGKNPMIVLADADLEAAVDGAIRGSFVGAGQVCVSIERIYVHQSLLERFLASFAERARGLRMGAAADLSVEMGSLTTQRQLRKVEEHVRDALDKGATLVTGGRRRPDLGPLFYEPTILADVRENMTLFAEETFGPVVSVYPFATEEEAVEKANRSRYGLSASLWTRDVTRGVQVAARIRSGSVNVNEAYAAAWASVDSPIGGMKESGLRPRHGAEGLLKFTATQTVAVQRFLPLAPSGRLGVAQFARWMTRLLRLARRFRMAA